MTNRELEQLADLIAKKLAKELKKKPEPDYLDTAAACQLLGWSKGYLHNNIRSIPHTKKNGRLCFQTDKLKAWFQQYIRGEVTLK